MPAPTLTTTLMPKFQKKPVIVEAIQFTAEVALATLIDKKPAPFGIQISGSYTPADRELIIAWAEIKTLEGTMRADIGDWIIEGVRGEIYPCKPDIFELTYQRALAL